MRRRFIGNSSDLEVREISLRLFTGRFIPQAYHDGLDGLEAATEFSDCAIRANGVAARDGRPASPRIEALRALWLDAGNPSFRGYPTRVLL